MIEKCAMLALIFLVCISLLVFGASFVAADLTRMTWGFLVPLFFALIFLASLVLPRRCGGKYFWSLLREKPLWFQILYGIVSAFVIVNIIVSLFFSQPQGSVEENEGRYVSKSTQEVKRELTEEDRRRFETHVARGFSGFFAIFSLFVLQTSYGGLKEKEQER